MTSDSDEITFRPIGIIYTPFESPAGMPIQPAGAKGVEGKAVLFPEFRSGLQDLDEFSHVILLYYFHRSGSYTMKITPFLDNQERGLFATRAPNRPNGIGLSIVELADIIENTMVLRGVDMLNNTPLLDIKPYIPEFDAHLDAVTGWFGKNSDADITMKSDKRFQP